MKSNIFLNILFLAMISLEATAQTTDLARVEYLFMPFSNSGNSLTSYRALVQVPIPLDKEKNKLLVVGLGYRYFDLDLDDEREALVFNNHEISSIQVMDGHIGYVWRHNSDWRFGVKAGVKIHSDLEGKPVSDDFVYEFGAYGVKDKRKNPSEGAKPYRLIFGIVYSTIPGRWYPLPLINYYKEFSPNWTYTLGVPKTNIRYYLNDSHKDAVQAYATLENVYANIQQNFTPQTSSQNLEGKVAESIQLSAALLGVGYEHFFTKNFIFYAYAAHSVYNDFRLEDGDGKKIYKISSSNSPYFRVGLKLKY